MRLAAVVAIGSVRLVALVGQLMRAGTLAETATWLVGGSAALAVLLMWVMVCPVGCLAL